VVSGGLRMEKSAGLPVAGKIVNGPGVCEFESVGLN
jgi:hypothetical protein